MIHISKLILLISILCFCIISLVSAQTTNDTTVTNILNRAYEMLSQNPQGAIELFQQGVKLDPSNVLAIRQLGYLYVSQGKFDEALEHFNKSEQIQPSDTIKLQIAYILLSKNQNDDAQKILRKLQLSHDQEIKEKATRALEAPVSITIPKIDRWWTYLYTAPYYDTRWYNWFLSGFVQQGYYLSDNKIFSGYGILSFSKDTKSKGGTYPQIFSDNALILAVGIRVNPFTGFLLDVHQGIAIDLIDKGSENKLKGDFRAIAIYSNGLYASFYEHKELKTPFSPFIETYTSAGYYSRYKNGICYMQLKAGERLLEVSKTVFDLYGRFDLVLDSEKQFFNNLIEWGLGTRLIPFYGTGLQLCVEYHRGRYWDVTDAAYRNRTYSKFPQYYNSYRIFIIYEHSF